MRTSVCNMFNIELPIFAFSHCRDVVAEVSKAGGMGVLGTAYLGPEELEQELKWIDEHVEGKPYGVDMLMPGNFETLGSSKTDLSALPEGHVKFLRELLDNAGIRRLPEDEREKMLLDEIRKLHFTPEESAELFEVALRHPVKLVVSALGVPPRALVDRLHSRSIKVGSLIGNLKHALRQKAGGVDLLVAQGMEAGGHTGQITSMILWPEVVDAVAPLPVLAAGGIGRGRQMAAALALGAQGIWCGSIWLGTTQSELTPAMKQRFFEAAAEDTVQTRIRSGKPARLLRSKLTDAWEQPGAPKSLPTPWQPILMVESRLRIDRAQAREFMTYPVGQIVGRMKEEISVKQVIYDMLEEFIAASERLSALINQE